MALFTRNWKDIESDLFKDEGLETLTSVEQVKLNGFANKSELIKNLNENITSSRNPQFFVADKCRIERQKTIPKLRQ